MLPFCIDDSLSSFEIQDDFFFSFTKGFSYTKGLFHRFDKYFSVSDTGGSLSQCIHEDSGYGSPAIVNFGI